MLLGLFIFSSVYSQKEIKGTSTYFPQDSSVNINVTELNYLIHRSHIICSKIDTLDDGAMIKTIEIKAVDNTFRIVGAYIESSTFFPSSVKNLKCSFVVLDFGEIYESYSLDSLGLKYFETLLNRMPLVCVDSYEWIIVNWKLWSVLQSEFFYLN